MQISSSSVTKIGGALLCVLPLLSRFLRNNLLETEFLTLLITKTLDVLRFTKAYLKKFSLFAPPFAPTSLKVMLAGHIIFTLI